MKKLYLVFFSFLTVTAFAQPAVRIYAYSQETTPGIIPVDENGRPIRSKEPLVDYYLFAAYSPAYNIRFDGIKGQGYSVQTSKAGKTPITVTNNDISSNPVTTVLVPATKLTVISLQPISPSGNEVKANWFREMLRKNELIISYFYKGKKYFIPFKKIKSLPPVFGV
jgi:hypothetical protein